MSDRATGRRTFLARLLAAGGVAALARPGRALAGIGGIPGGDALGRVVRVPESARVVGRAYLRREPAEANAARLRERILADLGLDADAAAASADRELRERLRHRVRADFAAGRIVKLDGWILSLTEVRLSALVALERSW